MRIISNKNVRKFQEGGAMPAEAPMDPAMAGGAPGPAPAPGPEGGDPIMQIAQIAMQALQTQDCEAAMAACDAFLQLIQGGQGGPPPGGAPQGEPVFKRGGKLKRRQPCRK